MSETVIKVENLSKRYRIGLQEKKADTFAQQMWNNLKAPVENFRRIKSLGNFGQEDESVHWALKDVSFEVKQGEVLGIIGKNGAGKSTLLKILSKITEPTSGRVEMNGRVAALLEVGTGFHPELSGRDNIYMNGTILGMTKREIDRKLEEIIDFSGVEKYIDTPVKFYSSGMRVRLGFSVAAHMEPEILIIDEVLAVGDYEFQKKCLGKMEHVSQRQGRTVLFVSHQMDAINRLCNRVILLDKGAVSYNGDTDIGTQYYFDPYFLAKNSKDSSLILSSSKEVELMSIKLSSDGIQLVEQVDVRKSICVEIEYNLLQKDLFISPGINVHNEKGDHIFTSHNVEYMISQIKLSNGKYFARVEIPSNYFSEGVLYFSIAFMRYEPFKVYLKEDKVLAITVVDKVDGTSARGIYSGNFPGIVRPKLNWKIEKL